MNVFCILLQHLMISAALDNELIGFIHFSPWIFASVNYTWHWANALNYGPRHGLPLELRYVKTKKSQKEHFFISIPPQALHLQSTFSSPFFDWAFSMLKKGTPNTTRNQHFLFGHVFPPPKTAPAVRLRRFLKDHMASLVRSPLHRPMRMGFVGRLWISGSEMVGEEMVENQMALGFDWGEIIPLVAL